MKALDPGSSWSAEGDSAAAAGARLNLGRSRACKRCASTIAPRGTPDAGARRRMGVDLELWAIEKDCAYFREVFGRELSTAVA